jgi:hypothetical protein
LLESAVVLGCVSLEGVILIQLLSLHILHHPRKHPSSRESISTISTVSNLQQSISNQANQNSTILLQLQAQQPSPKKILHPQDPPLVAPRPSMEVVAVVEKEKSLDRNT